MNDAELQSKLKRVPVPGRGEDYWNDFPARVRWQLGRERSQGAPRRSGQPRLLWAGCCVLAVALWLAGFQFHPMRAVVTAFNHDERHLHAQLARLDVGLHRLMLNTDGMGYLLGDAN
jgi:hypothetical protein